MALSGTRQRRHAALREAGADGPTSRCSTCWCSTPNCAVVDYGLALATDDGGQNWRRGWRV
jgi:hypothetical protein